MKRFIPIIILLLLIIASSTITAQNGDIDQAAIIDRIIAVENKIKAEIKNISFDAEYIEGELEKDGTFKEKVRFIKKIYFKYTGDSTEMKEEYLEYYKDGELQEMKKLEKEVEEREKKKKKRKSKDLSFSLLSPLYEENSAHYEITYQGIAADMIEGRRCYHIKVKAVEEHEDYINGDYYFDTETFNPVRIDFSPAKLVKKMMFKMKEINLSILYGPSENGMWFPIQFDVSGKGKAMFFIGVKFSGTEYYRNPVINSDETDNKFEISEVSDER